MFILNEMEIKITRFPDNTIKFDIPKDTVRSCNKLQWNFESMEELFVLIGISEKLKSTSTTLFIPYLPNARMDKIYDKMEGFMLKYFVESVDSLGFKTVIILDPHSDIYKQFVRKSTWIESRMLQSFISRTIEKVKVMNNSEELVIVYPDKGARNRYSKLTKIESDLYGEKVRNQETGEIISFDLIGEVPSDEIPVLIVDDISSLGGTFYFTAKKLREKGYKGKIYLYITHAEETILKGKLVSEDSELEKIFTTNSLLKTEHEKIIMYKL